ncbi:MAG: TRAP transporter small permease [Deltaproteobacteria bacterium]|nr:TRAP transporter small permease [Deltaproteobacteria bacterium]
MDYDKKDRGSGATLDLILEKIKTISNTFMTILLIGLTLLLGASIAMRYFLGQPIAWSNAVARYVYIYIVMIGSAISYTLEGHAVIESFYSIMPRGVRMVFDLAHYLIVMGLSAMLIVKGVKYTISMWGVHSPVLSFFSMGLVYLAVPISFMIIFLYLLRKTIGLPGEYRR